MRVYNKSKDEVLAEQARHCTSEWSIATGLMFRLKPQTLVFDFGEEVRYDMHMFFVFFPIDVLFLGSDKKVVELKEGLKPFAVYRPRNDFSYVVELPAGVISETGTEVEDELDLEKRKNI